MDAGKEGVHHFGMMPENFEKACKEYSDRGHEAAFECTVGGAPLVYFDTVDSVGHFIELWDNNGIEKAILTSAYKALKKNGVLGLVAHRTKDSSVGLESAQTGYLTEEQVITIVEEVGFSFEARSEINANPSDSANHPKGVWTLPPMLRLGEIDKEKYMAIGESDRMTLKFIKK